MTTKNVIPSTNGLVRTSPLLAGPRPQQPVFLQLEPDPVFAVLHAPSESKRRGTGVVLCSAFGWEEICSHRSFLRWAEALADAGYPTLRFDLPGAGESGGSPRDPDRLSAWTAAVGACASWLKTDAGCDRVVAIGVGLGGMLGYLAAADGAPVDDLVLWSVPARGDSIARELRAMARLAADQAPRPPEFDAPEPQGDELEVWGFLLSGETVAALKAVDLTEHELPDASARRVLVLGRDQSPPDARLVEHLEQSGVSVTSAPGPGYEPMMRQPKIAEVPYNLFSQVTSWLNAPGGEQGLATTSATRVLATDHMELEVNESSIHESVLELDIPGGTIRGVLVKPAHQNGMPAPLCAVLLNSGAVRRVGMNRIWVETSRRWAAQGVPTLRLDLLGLGDSDGDEVAFAHPDAFYRKEFVPQVVAALDALEAAGLPGRFLVAGLCAGAYWSFQTALVDERVSGVILLNLWRFSTASELDMGRLTRRAKQLRRNGMLWSTTKSALTSGTITAMIKALARNPRKLVQREAEPEMSAELYAEMDLLASRGVARTMLMSLGEPIAQDIIDAGLDPSHPWPGVTLERIPIWDHGFRPIWAQEFVNDALDRALERTVDADAGGTQQAAASRAVPTV